MLDLHFPLVLGARASHRRLQGPKGVAAGHQGSTVSQKIWKGINVVQSVRIVYPYVVSMPAQDAELNDNSIDVIVTSWEIALREGITKSKKYAALIVDEGHRLKNRESRLWKRLGEVSCNFRLLLSGTPIQNRVTELLNLLYFLDKDIISVRLHSTSRANREFTRDATHLGCLNPEIPLPLSKEFEQDDILKLDEGERDAAIAHLRDLLKPRFLRRTNEDITQAPCEKVGRAQASPSCGVSLLRRQSLATTVSW